MLRSLVGSEMCIRDSLRRCFLLDTFAHRRALLLRALARLLGRLDSSSYLCTLSGSSGWGRRSGHLHCHCLAICLVHGGCGSRGLRLR
eukprot:TRINITY_DN1991_c0_g1_i4.p2 TRINITY_DN1991_c0_g1~~TRINITY_DN1991_c0_g1_i4.p2  ORF type:complete len:102 (+),score=33.31 TRINITY_DN1991_c0_g1_i4:43-306(+)